VAPGRVEALDNRVRGSTGHESSLENRVKMVRESAGGVAHPVSEDHGLWTRGSGRGAAGYSRSNPHHRTVMRVAVTHVRL
jgi:hypothetical protein